MDLINKKIFLAITQDMKIYECFVDNLKYLGFETALMCNNKKFEYKNVYDHLNNFFRKLFLNDKKFKSKLKKKYELALNVSQLEKITTVFDYSLIIRADLFHDIVLKKIIEKSKKNYSYQWDGLSRYSDIYKSIPLFKKFYVFDEIDLDYKHKTHLTNNFYFDCYATLFENTNPEYDVYYIGSYDNRFEKLIMICEFLKSKNLKLNIIICGKVKKDLSKYPYIKIIHNPLSYYENLKMVANSKILIDLHHENLHNGLSFRIFESVGYNKKIITTNKAVKNYDFYNTNNIHVIDDEQELELFLNSDFITIDLRIKEKYSFTNWIKNILEI